MSTGSMGDMLCLARVVSIFEVASDALRSVLTAIARQVLGEPRGRFWTRAICPAIHSRLTTCGTSSRACIAFQSLAAAPRLTC
eukprot:285618-Alexandrium_andersonii.AAC.1